MCGIAGILRFDDVPVTREELEVMSGTLIHRGPDDKGSWIGANGRAGFSHRRLSIIDLDRRSSQPFVFEDLVITYNGEIYNYPEIREELARLGHAFTTESDTEVLIHAYREWGEECLEKLDGMFAFALFDEGRKMCFAARDRFGEKPFYYNRRNGEFSFASEMKALFARGVDKILDDGMMYLFLTEDLLNDSQDPGRTFFRSVKSLPAGHCMVISGDGEVQIRQYWDLKLDSRFQGSYEDARENFGQRLRESVKRRLRSDVSLGSSLSGGVDSSLISALCSKELKDRPFSTFTAFFDDEKLDEWNYVEELQKVIPLDTRRTLVSPSALYDELKKLTYHQEEPFGSPSVFAQFCVMRLAEQSGVKVLLDGQGADEVFAGYYKYFVPYLHFLKKEHKKRFRADLRSIEELLGKSGMAGLQFHLKNLFGPRYSKLGKMGRKKRMMKLHSDVHPDFHSAYGLSRSIFPDETDLAAMQYSDVMKHGLGRLLRFADRNSMAFSREVRLPYLNHELVQFAFDLPVDFKVRGTWTKYLLRDFSQTLIPETISWRKDKKAFQMPLPDYSSPPWKEILRHSVDVLKKSSVLSEANSKKSWSYIMAAAMYEDSSNV